MPNLNEPYFLNRLFIKMKKEGKVLEIQDIEEIDTLEDEVCRNICNVLFDICPTSLFEVECKLGNNLANISNLFDCKACGCQERTIYRSYGNKLFGLADKGINIDSVAFMNNNYFPSGFETFLYVNKDIVDQALLEKMCALANEYVVIVGVVNNILENSVKKIWNNYYVNKEHNALVIRVGDLEIEPEEQESDGTGSEVDDWEGDMLKP